MSTQPTGKPFAGFEDFDGCVAAFGDRDDVEDPEALCRWLEEHGEEALSDPNAEEILTGLTTEFVSSVDQPAQDSEWLIVKDATAPRSRAKTVERPYVFPRAGDVGTTAKRNVAEGRIDVRSENDDGERQIAYAAVLIPNDVDKQGDVIPPHEVERSAHEYLAEYRKADVDHDLQDGAGVPVESWILKDETTFDLPDGGTRTYPEGTWIVGMRFDDDEWQRVKRGDLSGFSIYGGASPINVDDLRSAVESAKSVTKSDHETMTQSDTDPDGVAAGIDELKRMVKGVADTVDAFDDRLTDVEDDVDALKSAVGGDVPNNRMNDGNVGDDVPENDRMKAVEKKVDRLAEAVGIDPDDTDDRDVTRKALVEQTGAGTDTEAGDLPNEDYSGIFDGDDDGVSKSTKRRNDHENFRFAGGN